MCRGKWAQDAWYLLQQMELEPRGINKTEATFNLVGNSLGPGFQSYVKYSYSHLNFDVGQNINLSTLWLGCF